MQRYFVQDKKEDYLYLTREDLHHIKNVMRNQIGDIIECVYKEEVYHCRIEALDDVKVKILSKEEENHELNVNITIAIALVKEQKMDIILQKLTELGVNRIIPLKMERSIVKLDNSKSTKKQERWQSICKEASEQSKRNKVPIVEKVMSIDELNKEEYDKMFVCSTNESTNLLNYYLQDNIIEKNLLFVIGPEGGITEKEEQKLKKIGMIPISLGNRIMRVETAAIYIASVTNFCSMG